MTQMPAALRLFPLLLAFFLLAGPFMPGSALGAGPAFTIRGVEVTQGIQDLGNDVPLIAGRRTFVRVYIGANPSAPGGPAPVVRGLLTVSGIALPPGVPSATPSIRLPIPVDARGNEAPQDGLLAVGPANADVNAARLNLDSSLNFRLPDSWVAPVAVQPTLHLTVQLFDVTDRGFQTPLACAGCADAATARLSPSPPLSLRLVPIVYTVTSGRTQIKQRPTDLDRLFLLSWLLRAFPVSQVNWTLAPEQSMEGIPSQAGSAGGGNFGADDVLGVLQQVRNLELSQPCLDDKSRRCPPAGVTARTRYYGMVAIGRDFVGNLIRDAHANLLTIRGEADPANLVACGPVGMSQDIPGLNWGPDGNLSGWYAGHEIGHLFGRLHPGICGDQAAQRRNDPLHVDSDVTLMGLLPGGDTGPGLAPGALPRGIDTRFVGLDPGQPVLGIPERLYQPAASADVMSYCANEWVWNHTYTGLYDSLLADAAQAASSKPPPVGLEKGLYISGQDDRASAGPDASGGADFEPFSLVPAAAIPPNPPSTYEAVMLDAAGNTIGMFPIPASVYDDAPADAAMTIHVNGIVPFVPGTAEVVIVHDQTPIHTRFVSSSPPDVSIVTPHPGDRLGDAATQVTWRGHDDDCQTGRDDDPNCQLTYSLLYSADGGATWQAVDTGIQTILSPPGDTQTSVTVDLTRLPASEPGQAQFRVIATDGVNTTTRDSSPFTVIHDTLSVHPGDDVTVDVSADPGSPPFAGLLMTVAFGPLIFDDATSGGLLNNPLKVVRSSGVGQVAVALVSNANGSGAGTLAHLAFTVPSSLPPGDYPITLPLVQAYNAAGQPVSLSLAGSTVHVSGG